MGEKNSMPLCRIGEFRKVKKSRCTAVLQRTQCRLQITRRAGAISHFFPAGPRWQPGPKLLWASVCTLTPSTFPSTRKLLFPGFHPLRSIVYNLLSLHASTPCGKSSHPRIELALSGQPHLSARSVLRLLGVCEIERSEEEQRASVACRCGAASELLERLVLLSTCTSHQRGRIFPSASPF